MSHIQCHAVSNRAFSRPARSDAKIRCNAVSRSHLLQEVNIKTGTTQSIRIDNDDQRTDDAIGLDNITSNESISDQLKSIFLPRGFPNSVTTDYLRYQLWTFPSHVTGWISASLAGSSMLKALGVSAGPASTVGFSAAIKWVTKDGVGAIGRLFVGSRLGSFFDEDPKRWRMVAEGMTTLGLSLEIATQIYPSNFVLLAGSGTLVKSIGKGMGRPCFRVIQTHFSASNNVGDVAAKEEVWEVVAQMIGLSVSVGILSVLEATGTPEVVIPVWASVHAVHVALRYAALQQLCFPFPNTRRGMLLVRNHITSGSVLSMEEANREEGIQGLGFGVLGFLGSESLMNIPYVLGCSIQDIIDVCRDSNNSSDNSNIISLMELYSNEQYILAQHPSTSTILIALKQGALSKDILRSLWQASWIDIHTNTNNSNDYYNIPVRYWSVEEESLREMQMKFPDMEKKSEEIGWKLDNGVYSIGNYRFTTTDWNRE